MYFLKRVRPLSGLNCVAECLTRTKKGREETETEGLVIIKMNRNCVINLGKRFLTQIIETNWFYTVARVSIIKKSGIAL